MDGVWSKSGKIFAINEVLINKKFRDYLSCKTISKWWNIDQAAIWWQDGHKSGIGKNAGVIWLWKFYSYREKEKNEIYMYDSQTDRE